MGFSQSPRNIAAHVRQAVVTTERLANKGRCHSNHMQHTLAAGPGGQTIDFDSQYMACRWRRQYPSVASDRGSIHTNRTADRTELRWCRVDDHGCLLIVYEYMQHCQNAYWRRWQCPTDATFFTDFHAKRKAIFAVHQFATQQFIAHNFQISLSLRPCSEM